MGKLIVSAQMTMDSVMDQMVGWFDAELESEQDGIEQLRAADALILGRKTYEGFAAPIGRARRVRTPSSSIRCRNTLRHGRSQVR